MFVEAAKAAFAFIERRGYRVVSVKKFVERAAQLVYTTTSQRFVRIDYDSFDGCIDVTLGELPLDSGRSASLAEILGFSLSAYDSEKIPRCVQRTADVLAANGDLLDMALPTPEVEGHRRDLTDYGQPT
ncbi:MAG: hypothetical protein JO083_05745 [Candidatus Eremiobacteraeota bacterium]|nr:hypothetical protein [Candidatus Eremiobacteraeota bacterium]